MQEYAAPYIKELANMYRDIVVMNLMHIRVAIKELSIQEIRGIAISNMKTWYECPLIG